MTPTSSHLSNLSRQLNSYNTNRNKTIIIMTIVIIIDLLQY